jgi:hypothetical protein
MKMARASEADLAMAMDITHALESLTGFHPLVPDEIQQTEDEEIGERFDRDDREQCVRVLGHLLDLMDRGSLMRVVGGCWVLLDPDSKCVDPTQDHLELHPDAAEGHRARQPLPLTQWTPEHGRVLWWRVPFSDGPWFGAPTEPTWPGTHTHWTAAIVPTNPTT